MDRRQKALFKSILSVFAPLVILLLLSFVGTDIYFAYRMLHPEKRAVINTPQGYEQILQKPIWDEKSWAGAGGTQMSGWLIYQDHPAPTVILSHGYGSNREDLLSTSYRLWDAGYNVVTYDLRSHGQSAVAATTLGPAELDDLRATIVYAKELKNDKGVMLSDGRIGLYGVDLGGFVSLSAAARDDAVKAVVIDSIYPSQSDYYKFLSKTLIGSTAPPNSSLVEMGIFQRLLSTSIGLMSKGGTAPLTADQAFQALGDRPVMIIRSTSQPIGQLTAIAAKSAPKAVVLELPQTRSGSTLLKQDAQAYDDAVVAFFTAAPDFMPPPRTRVPGELDRPAKTPEKK